MLCDGQFGCAANPQQPPSKRPTLLPTLLKEPDQDDRLSFTDLVYKYYGVSYGPGGRIIDGVPLYDFMDGGPEWVDWYVKHAGEWNGDWGVMANGSSYIPPLATRELMIAGLQRNESSKGNPNLNTLLALAGLGPLGVPLYRGGGFDNLIQNHDFKVNSLGFVKRTEGISLNIDPAKVVQFGAVTEVTSIPDELMMKQKGIDKGHYIIIPRYANTLDEEAFQAAALRIGHTPYNWP